MSVCFDALTQLTVMEKLLSFKVKPAANNATLFRLQSNVLQTYCKECML